MSADGAWTAAVAATWRYAGDSGSEPARAEVSMRFAPVGDDAVAVAGFGGPDAGRVPVWLAGPVVVARSPGLLVVASGQGALGRSEADRYLRLAATAVDVVRRVLPSGPGRLVVEVPGSSAALDRAMDVDPGHTSGIAAVTVPVDGSTDSDSPVHVFVNPEVFDRLPPTGAQVVLSHEAVHVATEAARSDLAPWLVEGFADYVALRDVRPAGQHHGRPDHPPGAPRRRARRPAWPGRVRHGHLAPGSDLRERVAGLRAAGRHRGRAGAGASLPPGRPAALRLRRRCGSTSGWARPS